jgi:signal transduction histidine kinase
MDEGIGIPADYVDQVFFEFVRAPNAKRHAEEGTGLGLAIVKEVIEAHGGRIAVYSRAGAGTTFTIRLPLNHVPTEVKKLLQTSNDTGYSTDTGTFASSRG